MAFREKERNRKNLESVKRLIDRIVKERNRESLNQSSDRGTEEGKNLRGIGDKCTTGSLVIRLLKEEES